MSCETKNLIYVITCHGCNEFYIGETSTTLRARIHLDICGKKQFSVFPFYKILIDSSFIRKDKEKHFIKIFKPKLNNLV